MAPPAWAGESQSSTAFSMNPRDSRVVSIYDKYLYDPKDLESSDPRRRELARKASQLKLHGRAANHMDANGLRSVGSSHSPPAQRKSIAFSQNVKASDGHTASSRNAAIAAAHNHHHSAQHQNQRSSRASLASHLDDDTHDRDSGAFGLGLGMLGGSDSESDSDTDDERSRKPNNPALDKSNDRRNKDRPDSWTDRAKAVGQRPPDSASQNPPSLKLMALKSAKQGGDQSRDERNSRLAVDSNFINRNSRHGSTIGFSGQPADGRTSSQTANIGGNSKRLSARTALTKQLGLASPNPEPTASQFRAPSPNQPRDYFDSRAPQATQGPSTSSSSRNAGPPPIDVGRAQQHGSGGQQPSSAPTSTPNSATPLCSPGYSPGGMPSPGHPHAQGSMPPNVLQRGPPSPYGQRGPPGNPAGSGRPQGPLGPGGYQSNTSPTHPGQGPNAPHPSSLQAGLGGRNPPNGFQRGPGPQGRGPPGPNGNFGPSFSETPRPSKRQSIFRRSLAMFGGGPQAGAPGNGQPNHPQQRSHPPQKRQSLFRRSMAMLTGGGSTDSGGMGPQGNQQMRMPVPAPAQPRASSAPRVQGLQDDFEKPDHPRKSQFLGAGGEGAEWDTHGEGAKFWRRFSMAQKTAGTHKLEDGSKAWMASMARGRRKLIVIGVIALVSLVGAIVGVIVWREIVSPSGSISDEPSSVYKANLGAKGSDSASAASATSTSREAKATSTSTAPSGYYSRSLPADPVAEDVVKRHIRRAVTHELGAKKMRKRHFGRAIAAASPQQPASLADLD